MAVVDVAPLAMTFARVESAKSCATPSDTAVSRPMATSTSMRLNPRLFELNLARIVNRHSLRFAVSRDGDRHRRRNDGRDAADDFRRSSIRAELKDRIAYRRAVR